MHGYPLGKTSMEIKQKADTICFCPGLEVPQLLVRSRGLTAWRSTSRKSSDNYCCFLEMKATSDHLVQKGNTNGIDPTGEADKEDDDYYYFY